MSPQTSSPFALLKRSSLFRNLSPHSQSLLAAAAHERRHVRGELILQKGDRPTGLFVVASGKLKETLQSADGQEKIIELLGPGQTCGEAALFLDSSIPYCVIALTNCHLLHIDIRTIHTLIDTEPGFVAHMLRTLARRQYGIMRDIEGYSLHSPLQRLVGFLLDLGNGDANDAPIVTLPATKSVIASRLGMSPEAMSRNLRDLMDAHLIEVRGRRIALLERERLRELMH